VSRSAVPPPPEPFDPGAEEWPADRPLVRVDRLERLPVSFNPRASPARFRPVRAKSGSVVPTMYAADGVDPALSETIFHDLPVSAGPKHLPRSLLEPRGFARLRIGRPLRLVQLRGYGLRRVGATHGELIETGPSHYPATTAWGQAAYDHATGFDGLLWMSRQYAGGIAVMLFGDRCEDVVEQLDEPPLPLAHGRGLELIYEAANAAGIVIVD
jgi:hypothetical protein